MKWQPISEAKQDGTPYLLWYPKATLPREIREDVDVGLAVDGWYFASPKKIYDGWTTLFGFMGEPSHFAKITVPGGERE